MSRSSAIQEYKEKIMAKIVNNKQILILVDNKKISNPDSYIYDNFFNFIKIPDTPENEKTYICLEVNVENMDSLTEVNRVYGGLVITVYIITHVKLMKTKQGGTRTDLISALIDDMLSNTTIVGIKKLHLISNIAKSINYNYSCRIMTFYAEDFAIDCMGQT